MYSQYPLTPYGTLPCIFSFKRGGILPLGWGLDDALFVGCVCVSVCAWLAEVSIRHATSLFVNVDSHPRKRPEERGRSGQESFLHVE